MLLRKAVLDACFEDCGEGEQGLRLLEDFFLVNFEIFIGKCAHISQ